MMKGPPRLTRSGSDFESKLLRAGKTERPRRESLQRALVAASAVGLATCGGAAVKTGASAAKLGVWLTLASAVLLGAAAIVAATPSTTPEPRAPVATPTSTPTPTPTSTSTSTSTRVVTPTASAAPVTAARPKPRPLPSPASPSPPPHDDELTLLRRAKQQLATQAPAAALETLDAYARAFPRGTFGEEAEALRVEALAASGASTSAQRAAALFLERHPGSPYAERVRSCVVRMRATPIVETRPAVE